MGGEATEPTILRYAAHKDGAKAVVATEMGELNVGFSHFSPAGCVTGDRATNVAATINYGLHSEECECEAGVDVEVILEDSVEDEERQRKIALVVATALTQISAIHISKNSQSV